MSRTTTLELLSLHRFALLLQSSSTSNKWDYTKQKSLNGLAWLSNSGTGLVSQILFGSSLKLTGIVLRDVFDKSGTGLVSRIMFDSSLKLTGNVGHPPAMRNSCKSVLVYCCYFN